MALSAAPNLKAVPAQGTIPFVCRECRGKGWILRAAPARPSTFRAYNEHGYLETVTRWVEQPDLITECPECGGHG
jgi:hypothetical protein